jgi:hypothetical protein
MKIELLNRKKRKNEGITYHAYFQLIEKLLVQLLTKLFRYLLRTRKPVVMIVLPRQMQIRKVGIERSLDLQLKGTLNMSNENAKRKKKKQFGLIFLSLLMKLN